MSALPSSTASVALRYGCIATRYFAARRAVVSCTVWHGTASKGKDQLCMGWMERLPLNVGGCSVEGVGMGVWSSVQRGRQGCHHQSPVHYTCLVAHLGHKGGVVLLHLGNVAVGGGLGNRLNDLGDLVLHDFSVAQVPVRHVDLQDGLWLGGASSSEPASQEQGRLRPVIRDGLCGLVRPAVCPCHVAARANLNPPTTRPSAPGSWPQAAARSATLCCQTQTPRPTSPPRSPHIPAPHPLTFRFLTILSLAFSSSALYGCPTKISLGICSPTDENLPRMGGNGWAND